MKFVSWNVNGIRACMKKGFADFFTNSDSDFFCLQESKAKEGQVDFSPYGYHAYWHSADKPGYAGTVTFTKHEPISVSYDFALLGVEEHSGEGRILTLEYPNFYLLNTYTPNSQRGLTRLEYRMTWQDVYLQFLQELDKKKPLIICGDLNVAHQEIDIKNHKSNHMSAGFTDQEREKMSQLLNSGFIDTYRHFNPDKEDAYTLWSYMPGVRERNVGWRIDYFLVSQRLIEQVTDCIIYSDIYGSDHCPVGLSLR